MTPADTPCVDQDPTKDPGQSRGTDTGLGLPADWFSQSPDSLARLWGRVARYEPHLDRSVAEIVVPIARQTLHDLPVRSVNEAISGISVLTHLLAFAHGRGKDVTDLRRVLNQQVVVAWIESTPSIDIATKATRRAMCRRWGEVLYPAGWGNPLAYSRTLAKAPYSATEEAQLRDGDSGLPQFWAARLQGVVALGFGAGIAASDHFLGLSGRHVRVEHDRAIVDVPGRRARRVYVERDWADAVVAAAERVGDGPFMGDSLPLGKSCFNLLKRRTSELSNLPEVVASRFRATWIVRHLRRRTPLDVVLRAAGMQGPGALDPYFQYAPSLDDDSYAALLLGPS